MSRDGVGSHPWAVPRRVGVRGAVRSSGALLRCCAVFPVRRASRRRGGPVHAPRGLACERSSPSRDSTWRGPWVTPVTRLRVRRQECLGHGLGGCRAHMAVMRLACRVMVALCGSAPVAACCGDCRFVIPHSRPDTHLWTRLSSCARHRVTGCHDLIMTFTPGPPRVGGTHRTSRSLFPPASCSWGSSPLPRHAASSKHATARGLAPPKPTAHTPQTPLPHTTHPQTRATPDAYPTRPCVPRSSPDLFVPVRAASVLYAYGTEPSCLEGWHDM